VQAAPVQTRNRWGRPEAGVPTIRPRRLACAEGSDPGKGGREQNLADSRASSHPLQSRPASGPRARRDSGARQRPGGIETPHAGRRRLRRALPQEDGRARRHPLQPCGNTALALIGHAGRALDCWAGRRHGGSARPHSRTHNFMCRAASNSSPRDAEAAQADAGAPICHRGSPDPPYSDNEKAASLPSRHQGPPCCCCHRGALVQSPARDIERNPLPGGMRAGGGPWPGILTQQGTAGGHHGQARRSGGGRPQT